MTTHSQNIQTLVLILFGTALNWSIADFWPWRWLVPTGLLLVEAWLLLQEEDTLAAKGAAIRAIVLKPKRRKEFLRDLLHLASRAALIGVVLLFGWSNVSRWQIERVEVGLS